MNLHGGEAESIITKSRRLANDIEAAACDSCESVVASQLSLIYLLCARRVVVVIIMYVLA